MKTKFTVLAAGMAVVSMMAVTGCKAHHGHDPKKVKEHVESSLKKVGASEEQRVKVGAIMDRIIADAKNLRKNSQGLRENFVNCLLLDKPNKEWLHATVDEKAKELTAFAHRTVDSLVEIGGTLTPEQRAELKAKYATAHGKK